MWCSVLAKPETHEVPQRHPGIGLREQAGCVVVELAFALGSVGALLLGEGSLEIVERASGLLTPCVPEQHQVPLASISLSALHEVALDPCHEPLRRRAATIGPLWPRLPSEVCKRDPGGCAQGFCKSAARTGGKRGDRRLRKTCEEPALEVAGRDQQLATASRRLARAQSTRSNRSAQSPCRQPRSPRGLVESKNLVRGPIALGVANPSVASAELRDSLWTRVGSRALSATSRWPGSGGHRELSRSRELFGK